MDGLSFTTFLKLALMPTTQGKLGVLQRMHNSSDGYDFYKRLKLAAREVAMDPMKASEVVEQLQTIKKPAEREHNLLMAQRFLAWLQEQMGLAALKDRPSGKYQTTEMAFHIRLSPEIAYTLNGDRFVTYLWATKLPTLTAQTAGAGLWMLRAELAKTEWSDANFQILDLRNNRTFDKNVITNQSESLLKADIALLNAIWVSTAPLSP